jgi:hypothetical protein
VKELLNLLTTEVLFNHINKKSPRDFCVGSDFRADGEPYWFIGVGFDPLRGTDHNTVPPEPGWIVWVEAPSIREALVEAVFQGEAELWS